MRELELWAGAECTVNRVGDRFFDQIVRTGHHDRADDIDRLASLGARRVRFPVLIERVAPRSLDDCAFEWSDVRLARLRDLGVEPIVGLVHHGSGPRRTHLCDPAFPAEIAAYARLVAERYPDVRAYTPINEPNTTARFSGLYGAWFPHGRDTATYLRALMQETFATRAAMRSIREVRPDAQLVQTEDLGKVYSTERLAYQRDYENHRRWLSLDLLCGRVTPGHPLFRHLLEHGIGEDELASLVDDPCPPDLIGVNYYLTSDRFLDDRLELHPPHTHGGNGRHRYADVEAVRVHDGGIAGHRALLEETHDRYDVPLAITEAHLCCTREEQMRWFLEAWRGACEAREAGADVRAVTLWSVFGAVDWSNLVTRETNHYEVGAFDVRVEPPRETAIATLVRELAEGMTPSHPAAAGVGWWRTPARWIPALRPRDAGGDPVACGATIAILGDDPIAERFARACELRGLAWSRTIDETLEPWAIVEPQHLGPVSDAPGAIDELVHRMLDLLIDGETASAA